MEWQDDGIIIGGRRHGETSLILEVMTRAHGRHLGLVKGGRGKRMQPLLQPGNAVRATWRARLDEHLGFYAIETTRIRAADLMATVASLHGLNLVTGLLRLLAEREPHESLYDNAEVVLDRLADSVVAPVLLVRFEAALLAESGFGLDLTQCAATGRREDLGYVSPKTGRAVSREVAAPYRARLLRLPPFLRNDGLDLVSLADLVDGFALTGFFLERHLYAPRGQRPPVARDAFIDILRRNGTDSGRGAQSCRGGAFGPEDAHRTKDVSASTERA